MTDIYLYENINEYAAQSLNRQLKYAEGSDVNIRITTRGGYTPAGVAVLTGIENHDGRVKMSVDGDTSSFGAFMLLFADEVEMSDMAELMFHKVAFPNWYDPSDSEKENLVRENKRFKKKMEQRFGDAGTELIADIFKEGERKNVYLTAAKAKKLGLVNKILTLTPKQKQAFEGEYHKQMLAEDKPKEDKVNININSNTMEITQEDLDKRIQAAKEAGKAEGELAGIELGKQAELGRVESWQAFDTVDPVAVKTGIESGKAMSDSERNKFLLKAATSKEAKADDEENAEDNNTSGKEALLTVEAQKEAANKKELEELIGVKLD